MLEKLTPEMGLSFKGYICDAYMQDRPALNFQ